MVSSIQSSNMWFFNWRCVWRSDPWPRSSFRGIAPNFWFPSILVPRKICFPCVPWQVLNQPAVTRLDCFETTGITAKFCCCRYTNDKNKNLSLLKCILLPQSLKPGWGPVKVWLRTVCGCWATATGGSAWCAPRSMYSNELSILTNTCRGEAGRRLRCWLDDWWAGPHSLRLKHLVLAGLVKAWSGLLSLTMRDKWKVFGNIYVKDGGSDCRWIVLPLRWCRHSSQL